LAAAGTLHDAKTLRAQTERLLADAVLALEQRGEAGLQEFLGAVPAQLAPPGIAAIDSDRTFGNIGISILGRFRLITDFTRDQLWLIPDRQALDAPFDRDRLGLFLETLLEWYGADLLRYKGIVAFENDPRRWIFQGVHRQQSLALGDAWADDEPRASAMVFIGTRLPRDMLQRGLDKCIAGTALD
jgi:hypothetical protein